MKGKRSMYCTQSKKTTIVFFICALFTSQITKPTTNENNSIIKQVLGTVAMGAAICGLVKLYATYNPPTKAKTIENCQNDFDLIEKHIQDILYFYQQSLDLSDEELIAVVNRTEIIWLGRYPVIYCYESLTNYQYPIDTINEHLDRIHLRSTQEIIDTTTYAIFTQLEQQGLNLIERIQMLEPMITSLTDRLRSEYRFKRKIRSITDAISFAITHRQRNYEDHFDIDMKAIWSTSPTKSTENDLSQEINTEPNSIAWFPTMEQDIKDFNLAYY